MGLILLGHTDLEEAVELGPVRPALGRLANEHLDVGEAQDRRKTRARQAPARTLALPVADPIRLEALDRLRRDRGVEPGQGDRVGRQRRADEALGRLLVGPRLGPGRPGRSEQEELLPVADEARLA